MRQQTGFLAHQRTHRNQIIDGVRVAECGEFIAGGFVTPLGLVTQRKERLVAARLATRAGHCQHLVGGQISLAPGLRCDCKSAVVTRVATQPRQRNKHLA